MVRVRVVVVVRVRVRVRVRIRVRVRVRIRVRVRVRVRVRIRVKVRVRSRYPARYCYPGGDGGDARILRGDRRQVPAGGARLLVRDLCRRRPLGIDL